MNSELCFEELEVAETLEKDTAFVAGTLMGIATALLVVALT